MTPDDDGDWPDEVVAALRGRAARPLRTSAAEAAAKARVPRRTPHTGFRTAVIAGVAALLVGVVWTRQDRPSPRPPRVAETLVRGVEPLPENVVLWWLDPETPVYFVVAPAVPERGPS